MLPCVTRYVHIVDLTIRLKAVLVLLLSMTWSPQMSTSAMTMLSEHVAYFNAIQKVLLLVFILVNIVTLSSPSIFTVLIDTAEMVVLTLFGSYDGNPFIHPYCRRDTSNDDEPYSGNDELSGYRSIKQPFQCTDVSVAGRKEEGFPLFQTVQCVEASYEADDSIGCAEEERDPEFDLFYEPVKARNDATTPTDDEWYSN